MKKINLEEINKISSRVYNFIKSNDLEKLEEKKYMLGSGIYINVESYNTYKKSEREYESHRSYVDIQYIISGHEVISVKPVDTLIVSQQYCIDRDITFYSTDNSGKDILMEADEALILLPEDGHMPCISVDGSDYVKKMVVKIPIVYFKNIKYIVMDVDGTLTDGKVYIGTNGEIMKAFNIKDGCGIHDIALTNEIIPIIITGRESDILLYRCKELGITEVYQGVKDKLTKLRAIVENLENVAYIGDDINDFSCMQAIKAAGGLIGCPNDAVSQVKQIADYISLHNGGDGAVREYIEWITMAR